MRPARFAIALLILTGATMSPASAFACVGDCTNNRLVTVDEIVTGVSIALGSSALEQCRLFDDNGDKQVTVDELLTAVTFALTGCPTYGGDYIGSVAFGAPWSGEIRLHVSAGGQISGMLLVSRSGSPASGFSAAVPLPPGGASVALSGASDPASGAFTVSGSLIDSNGQPAQVGINGTLPGPSGQVPVSVQVGPDTFPGSLAAAGAAVATPTATPTATATSAITFTPTPLVIFTPTATWTATQAPPSATATPTQPASPTPTTPPTATRTPTSTPSTAPSATSTPASAQTATVTPTSPPAGAARIVFAGGSGDFNIFVINVDGSGKTKLTNFTGMTANPAWSPDGSKIALAAPYNTGADIAVMNADGSNFHYLTQDSQLNGFPAWSPTGDRIVFTSGGGSNVEIMNADGGQRKTLISHLDTSNGANYGRLSWCPDGTRIAFESTRPHGGVTDSNYEIWTMNPDGTGLLQLTNNTYSDRWPAWSRDTLTIAFDAQPPGTNRNLYLMNTIGSGVTKLTTTEFFGAFHAAWSHDGTQIAYSSLLGLRVANANGSGAVTVPNTDSSIKDLDFK